MLVEMQNLIICSLEQDGFHMAPIISEEIPIKYLRLYEKFQLFHPKHSCSRSRAIELIVNSLMNEQFQHEFNPSNLKMLNQIKKSYFDEISQLHDKVGAVDWGIPIHMVNMYKRNKVEQIHYGN